MKLKLVDFETAKDLKELEFDWTCTGHYSKSKKPVYYLYGEVKQETYIKAPEQALVIKWFRDAHNIYIATNRFSNGLTDKLQAYHITEDFTTKLPKFGIWRVDILIEDVNKPDWKDVITTYGDTYEEAESNGIKEGIKYLKQVK